MKKIITLLCLSLTLFACSNNDITKKPTKEEDKTVEKEEVSDDTTFKEEKNLNLLTGLNDLSDDAIGKRSVCVAINNAKAAQPQYGISNMDLMYEFPVEGGQTRFLAFFADYSKLEDMCSVRSSRYFFPVTAMGYDAFYVHWGYYYPDESYIKSLEFTEFEGLYNTNKLFGRDQERLNNGYALEHTSVFYGSKFKTTVEKNNYRQELKADKNQKAFNFNNLDTTISNESCEKVTINYGSTISKLTYDANNKIYLKSFGDQPQIDQSSKEQLSFKNLFILETEVTVFNSEGRNTVEWKGSKDNSIGYYITNGTIKQIHWYKASENDYLKFYDLDGNELEVNRGKSYITYTKPNTYSFE